MVSLARFEPSCSVYGRECLLEFFRQRAGNDADLCDLAGKAPPPPVLMVTASPTWRR